MSSEEQVDGFSLDAQRRLLQEHCAAKGWPVVEEYADEGKSARGDAIEKRPAFKRMMEDAEDGRLDVVVVHKIDRFSRNIRVTFECLELLARRNVGFVAVAQPDLDYTRPEGRLFMGMMATLAQYYSDNLSQETKKGKAERKAQGLYNGHIPFGMTKGPDGVPVANPETIAGLRLAFDLAAEGRSDRDIAQALNERGYRTTGARGRPNLFGRDTVGPMLQNRFYLGLLPGAQPGETVPGQHDAVLDRDLFDGAREQRERRATAGRSTIRQDRQVYSLSGLGVCARCGGKLTALGRRGKPRLYCSSRRQTGRCDSRSVLLAVHEAQVAQHLATFTIPPDYRERLRLVVSSEADAKQAYVETAVRRARLERQLARLKDLYLLGDLAKPAYLAERDRVRRDLAALAGLAATAADERERLRGLADLIADVAKGWELATQEQRNRLARLLFEEVVIDNEKVVAVKPRPELAGFFALDCQSRVCTGGSDGGRVRAFTGSPWERHPLLPHRGAAVGAADVADPQASPPVRGPRWGAGRARAA